MISRTLNVDLVTKEITFNIKFSDSVRIFRNVPFYGLLINELTFCDTIPTCKHSHSFRSNLNGLKLEKNKSSE